MIATSSRAASDAAVAGARLSKDCWWPFAANAGKEQPLIFTSMVTEADVNGSAECLAARRLIRRTGCRAKSFATATIISKSNSTDAAASTAGMRAGGQAVATAAEYISHRSESGRDSAVHRPSSSDAESAALVEKSAGAPGPRNRGFPPDLHAETCFQAPTTLSGRAGAPPAEIQSVHNGAGAHLHDASGTVREK